MKDLKHKKLRKGEDTMASIAKPTTHAFVLDRNKADRFLSQKSGGAAKALERFFAHQPKDGVVTPLKKR